VNRTIQNTLELVEYLDDNTMNLKTHIWSSNTTDSKAERIIVELADKPVFIDCGNSRNYQTQLNIKVLVKQHNLDQAIKIFGNKLKELQYSFDMQYFDNEELYQLSHITTFFIIDLGD
jgi:hypothetical protein